MHGLMYLLLRTAPLRLVYIPNTLFVWGNAAATAHNIATHETLFRLGILSDLFAGTASTTGERGHLLGLGSCETLPVFYLLPVFAQPPMPRTPPWPIVWRNRMRCSRRFIRPA